MMNQTTKAYPELKGSDRVEEQCGRCFGTGYIGYGNVESAHHKFGSAAQSCFDCAGRGVVSVLVSSIRARERRQARAEVLRAEQERADAEREAERAARQAERDAQRAAEAEAAAPVPTGRVEVTGELLTIRYQENHFSYHGGGSYKALVKDRSGFKVWGTLPAALVDELWGRWLTGVNEAGGWRGDYGRDYWTTEAKGTVVTFTATVEPSNDDPKFGFFKRPSRASVVE